VPDSPRIEELRRRLLKDPASIAFAQLAEEHRRAGDLDEAVRVCQAGLEEHPGYLSARVTLGRALLELGRFEEAGAEFFAVVEAAPDNLVAVRALADIHQRSRKTTHALRSVATDEPAPEEASPEGRGAEGGGAEAPPDIPDIPDEPAAVEPLAAFAAVPDGVESTGRPVVETPAPDADTPMGVAASEDAPAAAPEATDEEPPAAAPDLLVEELEAWLAVLADRRGA